jgi:TusA-related sulfurtransferase
MVDILDVRLSCCVLNRKILLRELKGLSKNDKLEFIAENTDVIKSQIMKIIKDESCQLIEMKDLNGSSHIIVLKIK